MSVGERLNRYRLRGTVIVHGSWTNYIHPNSSTVLVVPSWGLLPDQNVDSLVALRAANTNPRFAPRVELMIENGKWKSIHPRSSKGSEIITWCIVDSWPLFSIGDMSLQSENESRELNWRRHVKTVLSEGCRMPTVLASLIDSYYDQSLYWRIDSETSRDIIRQLLTHPPTMLARECQCTAIYHTKAARTFVPMAWKRAHELFDEIYYWENSQSEQKLTDNGYDGSIVIASLRRQMVPGQDKLFPPSLPVVYICYLSANAPAVRKFPMYDSYMAEDCHFIDQPRLYIAPELSCFHDVLDHACSQRIRSHLLRHYPFKLVA